MSIATCGHKVNEGISCTIDDGQYVYDSSGNTVPALTYGTYCAECLSHYHAENAIHNSEINKLFDEIRDLKNRLKLAYKRTK